MRKATKTVSLRRSPKDRLTVTQKREMAALATLPDDQIDTSDIPELTPGAWKNAVRGRFYRPVKQAVSLRLDADVVAWLKKSGKGYQTRANYILRERMLGVPTNKTKSKKVEISNFQRLLDAGLISPTATFSDSDKALIESLTSAEVDALINVDAKISDFSRWHGGTAARIVFET